MGMKDKISDTVDKLTGDDDNKEANDIDNGNDVDSAGLPRRQPDGDPPVPPVQVPESAAPGNIDPSAKAENPRP